MALTKARRAELEAELLQTMDRQDALKAELREALAEHRDQVKLHAQKLLEIRDLLSGREAEQTTIPGTETGTVKPRKAAPAKKPEASTANSSAGKSASGITWNAEDDDSRTGRSRSQARVYLVSAVRVTATGKLNWGWHLPGSALHHGGQSGYDTAPAAMAAAERHELHYWPREKKAPAAKSLSKADARAMRSAADEFVARLRKGEIVRWCADARARKVPNFVVEMTGLKTKANVISKYGENAVFEKGKPTPKPDNAKKPLPAQLRSSKQKEPKKRGHGTAFMNRVPAWEKIAGRYVDQRKETGLHLVPIEGDRWELQAQSGHERVPQRQGWFRNLARALTLTYDQLIAEAQHDDLVDEPPTAATLEPWQKAALKEAQARRSPEWLKNLMMQPGAPRFSPTWWPKLDEKGYPVHKPAGARCPAGDDSWSDCATCVAEVSRAKEAEAALATTSEPCGACGIAADQPSDGCEECQHAPGEPLDDLVGTREDAVRRHAAGKAVSGG